MEKRSSGIFLHITSLPGPYGVGTLGKYAYEFVDFLKRAGQTYWQVLPIGQTGFGDSPYQSFSGRAGNPYLIDLTILCETGLLSEAYLAGFDFGGNADYIDYGKLYAARYTVLRESFKVGRRRLSAEIDAFRTENADWLPDYALFMAVKKHFGDLPLEQWPDRALKARHPEAMARYREMLCDEIAFYEYLQYLFFAQWRQLKQYANANGVKMMGDLPIYVAADSVDVWVRPALFRLDEHLAPAFVAGVPPDYYSATGQLWGNPVYDWPMHEKEGYAWWMHRLEQCLALFDRVRIDHFRGFEQYWEIPVGEETAIGGAWREGPAMKLFSRVLRRFPKDAFVVEDLGMITPSVKQFLKQCGYPGMKVMVFAFDGQNSNNENMPHQFHENVFAYTSTHDSPPFAAVLDTMPASARRQAVRYMHMQHGETPGLAAVRSVWASVAQVTIAPFQDILSLGDDATINRPSVQTGNWRWRVREDALNDGVARAILDLTVLYGRLGPRQDG